MRAFLKSAAVPNGLTPEEVRQAAENVEKAYVGVFPQRKGLARRVIEEVCPDALPIEQEKSLWEEVRALLGQ